MSSPSNLSDILLLKALKKGNEKAFRKIFDRYKDDIFTYARSMLKSSVLSEEILQEVFLKVWIKRESIDPELSFKSYIFTITRNLTFNLLAKAANDKKMREKIFYRKSKTIYSPIEDEIKEREYEQIRQIAINRLPKKRKRVFELSRNEGRSYKEISHELGISLQTVKNHMSKSLKTITVFLKANSELIPAIFFFF